MDRDAHLQITGVIGAPVGLLAKNSEPAAERRVFAGKARARPDVGQVEDKIVDRISFVLESCGDRESFAGVEKSKQNTATRRRAVIRDQAELAPCVGR